MLSVTFNLSEKYRRTEFVRTGILPKATATCEIDPATMTPEERQAVVSYFGTEQRFDLTSKPDYPTLALLDAFPTAAFVAACARRLTAERQAKRIKDLQRKIEFGTRDLARRVESRNPETTIYASMDLHPEEADEADAQGLDTSAWRALYTELLTNAPAWVAEKETERQRVAAIMEQAEAERKAKAEAAKAEFEANMASWIEEHGSTRLQRGHNSGYDMKRVYVIERAKLEAPGYVVDFDDKARWDNRSSPTTAALDAEDAANKLGIGNAQIVWLTRPPKALPGDEDEDYFEECEAVAIRAYLGRYDLVKTL
jgi:hypothetical protein